jgi:hypothetical protein
MRPPSIFTLNQSIPFHLKRSFLRSDFSPLISSKKPQVIKRWSIEERERERGRKNIEKKREESYKNLFK